MAPVLVWSYYALPEGIRETNFHFNPQTSPFIILFFVALFVCVIVPFYLVRETRPAQARAMTAAIAVTGLFIMGGFEYLREIARKPYVIADYLYSTSVLKEDAASINEEGFLQRARWSSVASVSDDTIMEAGRELFTLQCLSCHTIGGLRNDIIPRTRDFTFEGLVSQLEGQGRVLDYMPPFLGSDDEKQALARYIHAGINGKGPEPDDAPSQPDEAAADIPAFDRAAGGHIVLAWSRSGLNFFSDCDRWFLVRPPLATLESIVVRRGSPPQLVTATSRVTYGADPAFSEPARHVPFWEHADKTLGLKLAPNTGPGGLGPSGAFTHDSAAMIARAASVPLSPYGEGGRYNTFQLVSIDARSASDGAPLGATRTTAALSADMGCKNCHGGGWKNVATSSGIADATAMAILRAHDRINRTRLYSDARNGKPRSCSSCHGAGAVMSLSASMHGFHANYINDSGADACLRCHPSPAGGRAGSSRDIHDRIGLSCVECHGTMDRHALALIKGQGPRPRGERLSRALKKRTSMNYSDIAGRKAWEQGPQCLTCHAGFDAPSEYDAFNRWNDDPSGLFKNSTDAMGIPCQACHGPVHALYPSGPEGGNRDNIQPLQYTGAPYPLGSDKKCGLCHTSAVADSAHHENMLKMFRNRQ
jgi:mono/diheme cytochrome c family protein